MAKLQTDGLVSLEQPLIRVPLEQFKKAFKSSQKAFEKDLSAVVSSAESLVAKANGSPEESIKIMDAMIVRLQSLKRKLDETKAEEATFANRSRLRLEHLNELAAMTSADSVSFVRWSKIRTDRILVDYALRQGFSETAIHAAKDANVEQLVDIELFSQARRVEEGLRKHSCAECLLWCKENSSTLKKMKSDLEFNLRIQEYIELIRARKLPEAIAYLRKWLTPAAEQHMKEIQTASALLAFDPTTNCDRYRNYFDDSRWDLLIQQFRAENCSLNNLTSQPILKTTLQAGLAALKTPMCYQPKNQNINCPVCHKEVFGQLAEKLPNSHHLNSCLVCRISGVIMNEDNPPMVLPNGYVYSQRALEEMAERNGGIVQCPRTQSQFHISQARKAFVS
ncbi:CTLH/CRA C-terminal to lish motif domain-containing protein [Zopfochytrium polystomum]|nr:CTLH/CRA C-terminal to lish motif domain-containing protein [Zopfochytrium polystomum]